MWKVGVALFVTWIVAVAFWPETAREPQVIAFPDSVVAYAYWPDSTPITEPWFYVAVRFEGGGEGCSMIYPKGTAMPTNLLDAGCDSAYAVLHKRR